MKKNIFLILCCISINCLFAQNIKNVTINTNVKGNNFDGKIIWYVNGDNLAFDMQFTHEGQQYISRFIPDKSKGIFHILSTTKDSKIYSTADVKSIEATPGFDPIITAVIPAGDAVISGINCKKIIVHTAGTVTECFIDPTIKANYATYETFFRSDYALKAMKELKIDGFPIAVKTVDLKGNIITDVQTVNMQVNSVSDDIFKIGKEYKTVEEINKNINKK